MDWLWWLQIGADALLVLVVAVLIFRLKSPGAAGDLPNEEDWQQFIKEASELGQEFDRLLAEKRELVKSVLTGLDRRIAQLEEIKQDINRRVADSPPAVKPDIDHTPADIDADARPRSRSSRDNLDLDERALSASKLSPEAMDVFRNTVLKLAKEGQGASEIAKDTGRPRGEVELILSLHNQD